MSQRHCTAHVPTCRRLGSGFCRRTTWAAASVVGSNSPLWHGDQGWAASRTPQEQTTWDSDSRRRLSSASVAQRATADTLFSLRKKSWYCLSKRSSYLCAHADKAHTGSSRWQSHAHPLSAHSMDSAFCQGPGMALRAWPLPPPTWRVQHRDALAELAYVRGGFLRLLFVRNLADAVPGQDVFEHCQL